MRTIRATELKNRLGEALAQAALEPVAIERHGKIVAWLVPPSPSTAAAKRLQSAREVPRWNRRAEERAIELCARNDFRPSRWLRAGDARMLAGLAVMLASHSAFNRTRMLALAERLYSGMSETGQFGQWLAQSPIQAARLLPMLEARLRGMSPGSP